MKLSPFLHARPFHAALPSLILAFSLTSVASAQVPVYLTQWGSAGSGDGQFSPSFAVAASRDGHVFVADTYYANRVQAFDGVGTFLTKWGSTGSGPGQFEFPNSIAVDADGNEYVTDLGYRVQKFTSSGAYLGAFGSSGSGPGQFNGIIGIAVDPNGNLYVGDQGNARIQKFTNSGVYLGQWGSYGTGNGQFIVVFDVACDAASNVYVSDAYANRVQKFKSDGTFLTAWGSYGSGPGQFSFPEGVEIDGSGKVYVVDSGNSRVQTFTGDGTFLNEWGSYGSGHGQFSGPSYLGIDADDNLFIADEGNSRVQKFGQPPSVPMALTLPGALNLRSLGHWMTAYLQPPAGIEASAIDISSIRFHGDVAGSSPVAVDGAAPTEIGDQNHDGLQDLMVKFPRDAVRQTLTEGSAVPVTVTGTVASQHFSGSATLRVPHAPTAAGAAAVIPAGTTTTVRWETPLTIAIQSVALLSSVDNGNTWTLEARGLPNTGSVEWAVPAIAADQARVAVAFVESADVTGYLVEGVLSTSAPFKIAAPVGVEDGAGLAFALHGVTPNPARGTLFASFSLPDATPARLELLDLSGRQVMADEVGHLGRGHHQLPLRSAWPAGVYWMRLVRGSQVRTTRIAILD